MLYYTICDLIPFQLNYRYNHRERSDGVEVTSFYMGITKKIKFYTI